MSKTRIRQLVNLRYNLRKPSTWDVDDDGVSPLFFNSNTEKLLIRVNIEERLARYPFEKSKTMDIDFFNRYLNLIDSKRIYTFKKHKAYSTKKPSSKLNKNANRIKKSRGKKRYSQIHKERLNYVKKYLQEN